MTEACGQEVNPSTGEPLAVWSNSTFGFAKNGVISLRIQEYDNDTCQGAAINMSEVLDAENISFILGQIQVDPHSGVTGRLITITLEESTPQKSSIEALYHIADDNRLCFTDNIMPDHQGFSAFPDSKAIDFKFDFNNCLIRDI